MIELAAAAISKAAPGHPKRLFNFPLPPGH
jgi:hypothetical protein